MKWKDVETPVRIEMLGTGSAFAKQYDNNNALVTINGFRLLVDCGVTAPRVLYQMNIEYPEIDGILITHLHADHVGGLEEIALKMKYVHHQKPVLFITKPLAEQLWQYTLRGGMENPAEQLFSLDDFFEIRYLEEGVAAELYPGLTAELIRTEHIVGKLSYSILFNSKLFYSSDTLFNPELLLHMYEARGCKYILHDCQLYDPPAVHCTLSQLLTLPEELQQIIWLYHYGDVKDQFIGKTGAMRFMEQRVPYHFP
ncbi:MBL fold metallo-hydrolase [Paenibacillus turpanensis]|uniref:MBL fold metallo-hydrolase n=1 Tax=Paenibacillus turpanensis TaxID=2689078 RepID=UPI001FB57B3D|nr:MBL fold metallo-hydrolase [Paenibacillus turpanensis]